MIGMNDCKVANVSPEEFLSNLRELCRRVSALGSALPILQTTNPILPGMAPEREPRFDHYMDIVRNVASEQNLPLIDHHRAWKEIENPGLFPCWMSDAIHPNQFGHIVFAHYILKQFGIFDPATATGRLFHP